ncbi:MAG: hypothetical protein ACRAVC_25405 [Trichormus sp.]
MKLSNLIPLLIILAVLLGCFNTNILRGSDSNISNIKNSDENLSNKKQFQGDTPILIVNDGIQRGIYLLEAWINPTTEGEVYAKVFDTKTGTRLSPDRISFRSKRVIGWSENGKKFFPYNAEITVYEGDWSHEYQARFELWHKSVTGDERKLVERTRKIYGWER